MYKTFADALYRSGADQVLRCVCTNFYVFSFAVACVTTLSRRGVDPFPAAENYTRIDDGKCNNKGALYNTDELSFFFKAIALIFNPLAPVRRFVKLIKFACRKVTKN